MRYFVMLLLMAATVLSAIGPESPAAAAEIEIHFLLENDPPTRFQTVPWTLNPELLPLWKRAMARPESELKRQVADSITVAHRMGHAGMQEAIPELMAVLQEEQNHPAARHAAANALIALDGRGSASALMLASQKGNKDLRQLVEPVLARWNVEAMRPIWRQRIASINSPRRDLILAIHGLGEQRDAEALEGLLTLAMTAENPSDIRLAAARAVGRITDQGLESKAQQLIARSINGIVERLCGASLISRHHSDSAVMLLQKLGADPEPTVAGDALRSLFAFDPKLVLPLVEASLLNPDANVRRVAIQTYVALPTLERIQTLSLRLNDAHPELRSLVRESFYVLSKDAALDPTIRRSSTAILNGSDWRGQEQAGMLLAALDEEGVAPRLLELLDSPRPEVEVSSAWGLKTLDVAAMTAPVLAYAQQRTEKVNPFTSSTDRQMAHLFEFLGRQKISEAIPLMEKYVPKGNFGEYSRSSAIWSLGLIQEGTVNEPLAAQLIVRVQDVGGIPPEYLEVRRASVLTLGRLRAKTQLAALKELVGDKIDNDNMELSIGWSIQQISGEVIPMAPLVSATRSGWFLEPIPPPKER
ncbi:MAG: hypothetical protein JSS49_07185 [Planctomycetes bacterium]|nr:hypothetical protein [Planctomycetota bacterium]